MFRAGRGETWQTATKQHEFCTIRVLRFVLKHMTIESHVNCWLKEDRLATSLLLQPHFTSAVSGRLAISPCQPGCKGGPSDDWGFDVTVTSSKCHFLFYGTQHYAEWLPCELSWLLLKHCACAAGPAFGLSRLTPAIALGSGSSDGLDGHRI